MNTAGELKAAVSDPLYYLRNTTNGPSLAERTTDEHLHSSPMLKRIAGCFKTCVPGHCKDRPSEHPRLLKGLPCMQHQCHDCGSDGSKAHKRRVGRWIGKVQQLTKMGYWVIELPLDSRSSPAIATTAKGLRDFRKSVLKVLAGRHGRKGLTAGISARGLWTFHWFGDYHGMIDGAMMNIDPLRKKRYFAAFKALLEEMKAHGCADMVINPNAPRTIYYRPGADHIEEQARLVGRFCRKYGCKVKDYSAIRFNPHLNIFTDSRYIEGAELDRITEAIRSLIPRAIIHYSYVSLPAQMVQKVKYVLRATFLDYQWNEQMSHELMGFVNMGRWGKWDDAPAWEMTDEVTEEADELTALSALEASCCPTCGAPIVWARPISMDFAKMWGAVPLGDTGYLMLAHEGAWHGHMGLSPAQVEASSYVNEGGALTPEKALRIFFLRQCDHGPKEVPGWWWKNNVGGDDEDEAEERYRIQEQVDADGRYTHHKLDSISDTRLWDKALSEAETEDHDQQEDGP